MHSDTFFVFAALDVDSEMGEQASRQSDAGIVRLELSTVSSVRGAETARGHLHAHPLGDLTGGELEEDEFLADENEALLSWAGERSTTIARMHVLAPASLLFITDARRLTAFDAGMSVIRHQLQALNRIQFALSCATKLNTAELLQQTASDVTSSSSIMAAAANTVANMVMTPPSLCVGVHNARVLVRF